MTEWQPIETAPKDGTYVLLFYSGMARPVAGYWLEEKSYQYGRLQRERSEWVVPAMSLSFGGEKDKQPTHWMPLPEPPQ